MFSWICNGRQPQMRLEKLQLPVESGWLGLPKLSLYHYAFGLKDLEQWMFPLEWAPLWLIMKKSVCLLITFESIMITKLPRLVLKHPIISPLQKVCRKTSCILGVDPFFKPCICYLGQSKVLNRINTPVLWREWIGKSINILWPLWRWYCINIVSEA